LCCKKLAMLRHSFATAVSSSVAVCDMAVVVVVVV